MLVSHRSQTASKVNLWLCRNQLNKTSNLYCNKHTSNQTHWSRTSVQATNSTLRRASTVTEVTRRYKAAPFDIVSEAALSKFNITLILQYFVSPSFPLTSQRPNKGHMVGINQKFGPPLACQLWFLEDHSSYRVFFLFLFSYCGAKPKGRRKQFCIIVRSNLSSYLLQTPGVVCIVYMRCCVVALFDWRRSDTHSTPL